MPEPTILEFSQQLAEACSSIEDSVDQMVDALRWRACLKYGFPSPRQPAESADTVWTVMGECGETPTSAIDAVLRKELEIDAR